MGIAFSASAIADDMKREGELVGTWCDMQFPNAPQQDYVIEIWRDQSGALSYHMLIRNSGERKLGHISYSIKSRDGKWLIDNGHGEYARKDAIGHLQIYDGLGHISTAKIVPANTSPDQCRSRPKG